MSSPYPAQIPPSSAPDYAPSPSGSSFPTTAGRAQIDPLAFGNVRGLAGSMPGANGTGRNGAAEEAEEGDEDLTGRRAGPGRTARMQNLDDIPRVKDATGEKVMESFIQFLESYTEKIDLPDTPRTDAPTPAPRTDDRFYVQQVKEMQLYELTTLFVDFAHILEREDVLAIAIQSQYYRFLPYLRRALQTLVRKYDPTYLYINQSYSTSASAQSATSLQTREFHLAFYNLPLTSGIRDLRMARVGELISISGTVTRTSEVRPELVSGTFTCESCRTVIRDVEQQFKYTEPSVCPNSTCNNRVGWSLNIEQSKFADWQKVRIQENANEIPTGSMPRSLDVILRSEIVEKAKAGDKCTFTGTFIVVPDVSQLGLPGVNSEMMRENRGGRGEGGVASQGVTGLKALGVRDLQYKTAFLSCMVQSGTSKAGSTDVRGDTDDQETQDDYLNTLTKEEVEELRAMVASDNIYQKLVASIAPTVYGHEIVKKGILLQLMGGVHKQTQEGIHLRGDINVCIVGDPSTSKSQFLKYVCGFLPRAVYTSGKASSAAGLTAAVVKDEESGEFTIEAGALMLADNGICAIDEFDKMDVADQVAIHEAMEQQTISIAKAGIQATLNARTSILAAANPVGGRYNRKMSLRANVAMSAPIMSRFDLFFVVLDECNEDVDFNIAKHIVNVHRFRDDAIAPEYSTESLQRYIRYARTFSPKLTQEASTVLVEKYRSLRSDEGGSRNFRITVRQLESMIRLSEAIARANCQHEITPAMVREAYSLLRQSIIHVEQDDINFDEEDEFALRPAGSSGVPNGHATSSAMQESMDAADIAAMEAAESSFQAASTQPNGHAAEKKKMRITYNRYMEIMNLCVLHLSEVERDAGTGVDREELIQWYLEQKEMEFETAEDMEYEHELIGKALTKLAQDNYLLEIRGDVREGLMSTEDESMEESAESTEKVYYVVHPQVDLENLSSSAL